MRKGGGKKKKKRFISLTQQRVAYNLYKSEKKFISVPIIREEIYKPILVI